MSNAFDTMVFLLCFSEITIITTAGRHDKTLLDTNGLQKFEISHMFFLFSLGTNRFAFWAASGVTSISIYSIDHITSILGRLWKGFLLFLGWKRMKSRFGRLLKVSSLIQGRLSRF